MFKENNSHQQQRMFTVIDQLPKAAKKKLENSWAHVFYHEYFCRLDETVFSELYSDTLIAKLAFTCPDCGEEIDSVQTKEFENCLDIYSPGDIVRGSSIRTGIVKETLYCNKCHGPKNDEDRLIYIVIWHMIYVGLFKKEIEAEHNFSNSRRLFFRTDSTRKLLNKCLVLMFFQMFYIFINGRST